MIVAKKITQPLPQTTKTTYPASHKAQSCTAPFHLAPIRSPDVIVLAEVPGARPAVHPLLGIGRLLQYGLLPEGVRHRLKTECDQEGVGRAVDEVHGVALRSRVKVKVKVKGQGSMVKGVDEIRQVSEIIQCTEAKRLTCCKSVAKLAVLLRHRSHCVKREKIQRADNKGQGPTPV